MYLMLTSENDFIDSFVLAFSIEYAIKQFLIGLEL